MCWHQQSPTQYSVIFLSRSRILEHVKKQFSFLFVFCDVIVFMQQGGFVGGVKFLSSLSYAVDAVGESYVSVSLFFLYFLCQSKTKVYFDDVRREETVVEWKIEQKAVLIESRVNMFQNTRTRQKDHGILCWRLLHLASKKSDHFMNIQIKLIFIQRSILLDRFRRRY